jgi:dCMP deaminase
VSDGWDKKYLALALHVASWSKDPSTKVGSVIVGPTNEVRSLGFNGPPRGVNDDVSERWVRPEKYRWVCHAEENALLNAARSGITVMASTLYLSSFPAKFGPCDSCCRSIIQAGIARVVMEPPEGDIERWKDAFQVGETMLREAGVEIAHVELCKHKDYQIRTDASGKPTRSCLSCNEVLP